MDFIVKLDDSIIPLVSSEKLLGVTLDDRISWNFQIENIVKKLNAICFCLRVLAHCVDQEVLKIAYMAYFQSTLL